MSVNNIMDDYDFIMPSKRFDEALVTLQLLLGLRTTDMLYFSSKSSGVSYMIHNHRCHLLKKSFLSEEVTRHLSSDEWFAKEYGDYLLVEASLDLTIEALGRDTFLQALNQFQRAQKLMIEQCAESVYLPCSPDGKPQQKKSKKNCLRGDHGCGHPCIEFFSSKFDSQDQHGQGNDFSMLP
ncbi:hypothetical protein ACHAWF_014204 [Thalassiosira exigua]